MGDVHAIKPLDNVSDVVALIQQITSKPREEVVRRLLEESKAIGSNVKSEMDSKGIEFHNWTPQLLEFYEQTDAFLYETSVWNASSMKNSMRKWIARFLARRTIVGGNALCYGDGLGFDSVFLSRLGFSVTSYDVSKYGTEYCRSVFELNSVDIDLTVDPGTLASNSFDVIMCLDVLEHVPDPVSLVKTLASYLKSDGFLIVNAPFYLTDATRGTHLRSNRRFSGDIRRLYGRNELRPIGSSHLWAPIVLSPTRGNNRQSLLSTILMRLQQLTLLPGRFVGFPYSIGARFLAGGHRDWVRQLRVTDPATA